MQPDVLCIGSVHWDVIGTSPLPLPPGADRPGRVRRQPGGVALNVAMALRRHGLRPALLSAVGRDPEGAALVAACTGLETGFLFRDGGPPTGSYVAIEGPGGLVAAVADTLALEQAGEAILRPLADGRLGDATRPWPGLAVLDGNLTAALVRAIAASPLLAAADLRVVPASPDKAARLAPLLRHPRATFCVNLQEAAALTGLPAATAGMAAQALLDAGAARALVTDGARPCAEGTRGAGVITATPPRVPVRRVTGAGDAFLAAHMAAERGGADRRAALDAAVRAAALHISTETDP